MTGAFDLRDVHIHYHRPPHRTDVFVQQLVYDDPSVKVTFARDLQLAEPMEIEGKLALEKGADVVWFTFPGAWHDIGRFHRKNGELTGIYANILTPCIFEPGGVWYTTDLFVDLWIPSEDGRWDAGGEIVPQVLDMEELRGAEAEGWVTSQRAERARAEIRRLLAEAQAGSWPPPVVRDWTRARILASCRSELGADA